MTSTAGACRLDPQTEEGPRLSHLNGVSWRPAMALPLICSIVSGSPEVIRAAATLFAPWKCDVSGSPGCMAVWRVEPASATPFSPAGWDVTSAKGEVWFDRHLSTLLTRIEYESIWYLADSLQPGYVGFHGALLSKHDKGVLILGAKESGKSSLACALWRAGWRFHCDDCVVVDSCQLGHAAARRVSLRKRGKSLWQPGLWHELECLPSSTETNEALLFHPHEFHGSGSTGSHGIALESVIFLGRHGADHRTDRLSPVPAAQAAMGLLSHSSLLWGERAALRFPLPPDWLSHLSSVSPLAQSVRSFDLARAGLVEMVGSVEKAVTGSAA